MPIIVVFGAILIHCICSLSTSTLTTYLVGSEVTGDIKTSSSNFRLSGITSDLTVSTLCLDSETFSTLGILKLLSSLESTFCFRLFHLFGFCVLSSLATDFVGAIVLLMPTGLVMGDEVLTGLDCALVSDFTALLTTDLVSAAPNEDEPVGLMTDDCFVGNNDDWDFILENSVESLEVVSSTGERREFRSGVSLLGTVPPSETKSIIRYKSK